MLQFLAPIFTAVAGALFLKEHFSKEQAFASCECRSPQVLYDIVEQVYPCIAVFSLAGVVLIARPSFLFGSAASEAPVAARSRSINVAVTPAQRLSAVG